MEKWEARDRKRRKRRSQDMVVRGRSVFTISEAIVKRGERMSVEVMWVTESRLRGIVPTSKVHRWGGDIRASVRRTLCGVGLPRRSRWTTPSPSDERCQRCAAKVKA